MAPEDEYLLRFAVERPISLPKMKKERERQLFTFLHKNGLIKLTREGLVNITPEGKTALKISVHKYLSLNVFEQYILKGSLWRGRISMICCIILIIILILLLSFLQADKISWE